MVEFRILANSLQKRIKGRKIRHILLFILVSVYSLIGSASDFTPAASQCKSVTKPISGALSQLQFEDVAQSRSFLGHYYDYQVMAEKIPDGLKLGLIKQASLREMVKVVYNYGDYQVRIRFPKVLNQQMVVGVQNATTIADVSELLKQTPISGGLANPQGLKTHFDETFEYLDFVFKQYRERKSEWPDSFLRSLAQLAFRYIFHSIYIGVYYKGKELVGALRLIIVPYKKIQELPKDNFMVLTQSPNWNSVLLRNGYVHLIDDIRIPDKLMGSFWKDLFPKGIIEFDSGSQNRLEPETRSHQDTFYVPTPMEVVLNQDLIQLRSEATKALKNLNEPGNFGISRQHSSAAALYLYFHAARLTQAPHVSRSLGQNSNTLTYAEQKTESHRFYNRLGLLPQGIEILKNPNEGQWDILGGNETAVLDAFYKRFIRDIESKEQVERLIQLYNQLENGYLSHGDKQGDYARDGISFGFSHPPNVVVTPIKDLKNHFQKAR